MSLPPLMELIVQPSRERFMSSFIIYAIGFLILLAGLIYGATLLSVPTPWIVAGALVILGGGLAMGVGKTRQKDIPEQ